jgi:capsular exopolysaccharide synthesis family protein
LVTQPENSGSTADPGPIRHFLVVLRRRWRLVALLWLATFVTFALYTFTAPRLYLPQAMLEIRPETSIMTSDPQDPAFQATRDLWDNYYRTQEAILTSAALHAETLKALPEPIRRSYEDLLDPMAAFSAKVIVEKVRGSFILKVGFFDPDKERATQIVNTLVSIYLEDANRILRRNRSGAAEVLSREALPAMRQKLEDAEKALHNFQLADGFIDPQERYGTLANSRRVVIDRITQIRLRKIQLQSQLDTLRGDGAAEGVFNPIFYNTKVLELLVTHQETIEAELARARRELKDDHPTILEMQDQLKSVQSKIQQVLRGVLKSFESDLAASKQEETAAIAQLETIEKQMADLSQRVARSKRLDAELTTARELYNSYIKKQGEESATSGIGLGSVRVIDPARVPIHPFKPNTVMNLALGTLVGLLLGAAAMFISEQLDDRIRSAREIEILLGLDVLAVIPKLADGRDAGDKPCLLDEASSIAEFETFRTLRAEVTTRLEDVAGPKIIAILSPMSSEGKSTVAANLAKVLAMDRRRVLIFDADLRRPSMIPQFGSQELPDLGAVLKDGEPLAKAIRPSRVPGVDIVGMIQGTSHAAELSGTPRFDEIFRKIREGYDFVIVDSAPVNQASESALIARRCDAALMVLRERRTSRAAANAARRRLAGMGVRILGTALNAVEGPETAYGYYGYYYTSYKPDSERRSLKT